MIQNRGGYPIILQEHTCARCGVLFRGTEREKICHACRKPKPREPRALIQKLSFRERQVARMARTGMPNKNIAAELRLTEATIKVYLHYAMLKLGAANRTELSYRAAEFGLTDKEAA